MIAEEDAYRSARHWMALAVAPAGAVGREVAAGLARYDINQSTVRITRSHVESALKQVAEAHEALMRAKIMLESINLHELEKELANAPVG